MCLKDVKLKFQNFISLSCGVLELLRKNTKGAESPLSPVKDRIKAPLFVRAQ